MSEALAGEMKTFNVRVLIVEPGIIDIAMARRIGDQPANSPYRAGRFASLFKSPLNNPVPPSLVANKILDIVDSGTWILHHLVGPMQSPSSHGAAV